MRVKIIAVGGKMPDWVETGYNDYARRLPRDFHLEMVELPLGGSRDRKGDRKGLRDNRGAKGKKGPKAGGAGAGKLAIGEVDRRSAAASRAVASEGERMLAAVPAADRVIALAIDGEPWSTEQLARRLTQWRMEGDNYSILIGGPDGLSPDCLQRAEVKWSLSALTLPHPLVRIVVIEQLYRAWTILQNHPYHK